MRLASISVSLSVFCLIINFGFGQGNKQNENLIPKAKFERDIETKYIGEYTTLFPVVNLDMFEHTEGLPMGQGNIKSVFHSTDGYLWISVWNYGLLRYDGYQFRSFIFNKDDSISMPSRNISKILPSANGGLWLVTDKGLIWFDLKTYRSKTIREIPQQVFEITDGWGCIEDKLGKLWIFGHGLYLYHPSNNRIEKISDSLALNAFSNKQINITKYFFQSNYYRPTLSPDGSIWLATASSPLSIIRIDPLSKVMTLYPIPTKYSYTSIGVLPDPDSPYIWTSISGRVGRFNLKNHSWLFIDFKKNNLIGNLDPYFMSHIENDKLWLVSGNTITILDTRSFKAQLYKNDQKVPMGLNMAPGFYGARWIWDGRNRLFCNFNESKRFTHFKILPQDEGVSSYWKDRKNNIEWFGTTAGDGTASLYRYDVRNRNTSRFKIPAVKAFGIIINPLNATELLVSVIPVKPDLATHTLFRFNTTSMSFTSLDTLERLMFDNASSIFKSFTDIILDKEENLWLNNFRKLLKYDILKDSVRVWDDSRRFLGIVSSSNRDFIWAGGKYLYKVYTKEHKIEEFQVFPGSYQVIPLVEDQRGNVLCRVLYHVLLSLKSSETVAFYNPSTKEISTFPSVTFLSSPIIDSNNNVIGLTKNGLLFYNTETRETRVYAEDDGILNPRILRCSDHGELLIDDRYRFPVSFFYEKSPKPPLRFLSVKASDKELSPTDNADSSSSVVLNHDENYISIEFAYLNFLPNRYNKYTCTLEGLDTGWHQLGAKNFISYFNLDPGSYTFRVKAIDTDGSFAQERILHVEIVPAFWQTTWFKVLIIIFSLFFIGSVLYWIHRNRMHKLGLKSELEQERIRQQQKELEFEKRLADLTLSALRSQINPHFIFNCLNSIKLYATQNDISAATDYLGKFSTLIRQVLDNSMIEQITLSSEFEVLRLYIEMEAMRFKEKLRYNISIDKAVDADYIEIPPLLLQPYVENAIWHGLMPKEEGGNLEILAAMKDKDTLLVQIKDDGIGRAKAAEIKTRIAPQHKSFGMKVTSERMNLINRKYNRPISITIDDLINENGEPSGTLVTIQIKIE